MVVDEYVLDTPVVRSFIDRVRAAISFAGSAADAVERIRPRFADLLADPGWLPAAYALIPPRDDIHRVRTTSAQTSVSIHLLTNDTGCVWRHAYDSDSGEERPFRSRYVNTPCGDDDREDAPAS